MSKNNPTLSAQLQQLPKGPGVYFHKDASGKIIYIGKAAHLNQRVRHYFQANRYRDPKTEALIAEIASIDWTETTTELDALFLEAELIRRYQPKYNILLRDDKSLVYVRIDERAEHPTVTITRRPLDDGARYFGPYASSRTLRRALSLLRRAFPYSTHTGVIPKRDCLHAQIGLCPGLESGRTPLPTYRANLQQLIKYLRGGRILLMKELESQMQAAASEQRYEVAARLRNQLQTLTSLSGQIVFSDQEALDMSKDLGLVGLRELLGLNAVPERIEGFDISHMQASDTVASMVVFQRGMPLKAAYRKFKMRLPGNDDFAHMNEVIARRFAASKLKQWGQPELCVIDGGKGQLSAALQARDKAGLTVPMIGLAKRFEQIIVATPDSGVQVNEAAVKQLQGQLTASGHFVTIDVAPDSHIVKLLRRIRDESHRFAVSYHTTLKVKRSRSSALDDIVGVGPATKKKLLRTFGSVRALSQASADEIAATVGPEKARRIAAALKPTPNNQ